MSERQEKFTPGPWEIADLSCCDASGNVWTAIHIGNEESREMIAECYGEIGSYNVDHDHIMANAALIAAAPEMYELLKKAQSCIDFILNHEIDDLVLGESKNTIEEIENILKNARGEQ